MSNVEWVKITEASGTAVPVRGYSINTDVIIPARFLKCISWNELGEHAFQDKRYENGQPLDHPFNEPRFQNASLLFVNEDFGSGSSREHAPQALKHWGNNGIKVIVADSYAGIFERSCRRVGIPAVTLSEDFSVKGLMSIVEEYPDVQFNLDLKEKKLTYPFDGKTFEVPIQIPEPARIALMEGYWDARKMLLQNMNKVREFESRAHPIVDYSKLDNR